MLGEFDENRNGPSSASQQGRILQDPDPVVVRERVIAHQADVVSVGDGDVSIIAARDQSQGRVEVAGNRLRRTAVDRAGCRQIHGLDNAVTGTAGNDSPRSAFLGDDKLVLDHANLRRRSVAGMSRWDMPSGLVLTSSLPNV